MSACAIGAAQEISAAAKIIFFISITPMKLWKSPLSRSPQKAITHEL
jgi:hypothetical protein